MIELKPPAPLEWGARRSLFLAGSIEMGAAPPWQAQVATAFDDLDVAVLNPRREDWDSSWRQSLDDLRFVEQVEWELAAQERADIIAMYFAPSTQAPITLLELGLFAAGKKVIVCCPDGFWRKGNVEVVCRRYGVEQVATLADLVAAARARL